MIRIGLTGGIGAGKSTVSRTFIERGAYHIDADAIAREVVAPGSDGLAQLAEAFGAEILDETGDLDRAALAAKAFVDEESRLKLNAITHPLVGARTQELLDAAPADAVVIQDIPLLVESGLAAFFHLVIIVDADAELRVQRLTAQRGMTEEDARARIAAQATDEQRREVADVWLDNSGEPGDLAAAAHRLWDRRLAVLEANVRNRRVAAPDAELIAADPDPAGRGRRLMNRLWALAGDKATGIEFVDGGSVPELTITARDIEAGGELATILADGGFPRGHDGAYGSADPGRPARVHVNLPD